MNLLCRSSSLKASQTINVAAEEPSFALLRAFSTAAGNNIDSNDFEAKACQIEGIFACPATGIEHRRPYFTMFGKMHDLALRPLYFPRRNTFVHFLENL